MNNYIYHGSQGLITLPERNVQTFPSGLVRIDRVYACRKTLADRFRRDLAVGNPLPFDNRSPSIDGAFIFPDPQETTRDDGFTEFRVSAYGRTSTRGNLQKQGAIERFDVFDYLYETYVFLKVLPDNVSLRQVFAPPQVDIVTEIRPTRNVISVKKYDGPINLRGPIGITTFLQIVRSFEQAIVIEVQTEFAGIQYRLYLVNKGINYISHTTQNFGAFSEYAIFYSPSVPYFAVSLGGNFVPT